MLGGGALAVLGGLQADRMGGSIYVWPCVYCLPFDKLGGKSPLRLQSLFMLFWLSSPSSGKVYHPLIPLCI
jgi:hypothetical protein